MPLTTLTGILPSYTTTIVYTFTDSIAGPTAVPLSLVFGPEIAHIVTDQLCQPSNSHLDNPPTKGCPLFTHLSLVGTRLISTVPGLDSLLHAAYSAFVAIDRDVWIALLHYLLPWILVFVTTKILETLGFLKHSSCCSNSTAQPSRTEQTPRSQTEDHLASETLRPRAKNPRIKVKLHLGTSISDSKVSSTQSNLRTDDTITSSSSSIHSPTWTPTSSDTEQSPTSASYPNEETTTNLFTSEDAIPLEVFTSSPIQKSALEINHDPNAATRHDTALRPAAEPLATNLADLPTRAIRPPDAPIRLGVLSRPNPITHPPPAATTLPDILTRGKALVAKLEELEDVMTPLKRYCAVDSSNPSTSNPSFCPLVKPAPPPPSSPPPPLYLPLSPPATTPLRRPLPTEYNLPRAPNRGNRRIR